MATKEEDNDEPNSMRRTRGGGSVPVPDPTVLTTESQKQSVQALRELIESRIDGMDKAVLILQSTVNRSPTIGETVARMDETFELLETKISNNSDKLLVSEKNFAQKMAEAEISRVSALDKAASSITAGLDKAEKQLQASLDRIQGEFRSILAKQDERLNSIFTEKDKIFSDKMMNIQLVNEEKFSSIATQFRERDTRTEQTAKDSKVAVDAALSAAKEAVGEQNKSNALAIAKSEAAFTKQIDQIGVIINTQAKGVDDKIDDLKSRLISLENRGPSYSNGKDKDKDNSSMWALMLGVVAIVIVLGSILGYGIFAAGNKADAGLQQQLDRIESVQKQQHPTP